jgi:hypothetical protein
MRIIRFPVFTSAAAAATLFASFAGSALAQHPFELVSGKPFDQAVPKDFYLEGNAIPTAKRNAVMVHLPSGARALFSLIDTTGYSADIVSKYVGMIITEGDVTICSQKVSVGSYGFGWARPASGVDQPGTFSLYNQAGTKLGECATPRDAKLSRPTPLQLVIGKDGTARLYYGRHNLELR